MQSISQVELLYNYPSKLMIHFNAHFRLVKCRHKAIVITVEKLTKSNSE